jgi:FtsH-binding integral membrane protein
MGLILTAKMVATVAAGNTSAQTIANAWPNYVRERINKTYMAFGAGIVMTGTAMVALFKSGVAHRMATASPWAVFGLSLVGTIGTMMMTQAIPYENTAAKYLAMASFNTMIGLTLSPILFMGGGLALRAAAMTGGIVG